MIVLVYLCNSKSWLQFNYACFLTKDFKETKWSSSFYGSQNVAHLFLLIFMNDLLNALKWSRVFLCKNKLKVRTISLICSIYSFFDPIFWKKMQNVSYFHMEVADCHSYVILGCFLILFREQIACCKQHVTSKLIVHKINTTIAFSYWYSYNYMLKAQY